MVSVDRIVSMSAQNNTNMDSTNSTYEFGPPRTLHGIPVDVFSYIFLIIGCTAPVLFIIAFVIATKCYKWRRAKRKKSYRAQVRRIDEFERFENFSKTDNHRTSTPIESSSLPRYPHFGYGTDSYGYGTENSRSPLVLISLTPTKSLYSTVISSDSNPNVYFKRPTSDNGQITEVETSKPHRTSNRDSGISVLGSNSSINGACNGYVTQVMVTKDGSVINYSRPEGNVSGESFSQIVQGIASGEPDYRESSPADTDQGVSLDEDASATTVAHREIPGRSETGLPRSVSVNSEEAKVLEAFDQIYQDFAATEAVADELLTETVNNSQSEHDLHNTEIKLADSRPVPNSEDYQNNPDYPQTENTNSAAFVVPWDSGNDGVVNQQTQLCSFSNSAYVNDVEALRSTTSVREHDKQPHSCADNTGVNHMNGDIYLVPRDITSNMNGGIKKHYSNHAFTLD